MGKQVLGEFDLPLEGDIIDQIAKKKEAHVNVDIEVVTEYYHKRLYKGKKALTFLEKRGITDKSLLGRFKIGYADGSILKLVSNGQLEALKSIGILNSEGKEVFTGCVVFPVTDEQGKTHALYGRNLSETNYQAIGKSKAYFFNFKAAIVYDEVILTESILDALGLIQLGIENTLSFLGSDITDEHVKILKEQRVKTTIFGVYSEGPNEKNIIKLKDRFIKEGFKVKVISPPEGKTWGNWTGDNRTKEEVIDAITNAYAHEPAAKKDFEVKKDGHRYIFTMGKIKYRILGVKKLFVSNLKVNIKAEYEGIRFPDNVDLCSARSRSSYSQSLARMFELEERRIENDLLKIVDYLEAVRDAELNTVSYETEEVELTEAERKAGYEFLQNPDMFEQIAEDMTSLGYVNEKVNKLIVYIAAVSRFMKKPLNIYIQAGSSGGKSALLHTLEQLLPPKDIWKATTISSQALNYVEQERFMGKVFFMGESIHDEGIEGLVRQMQSEGEISRLVTMKDEKTGEMKAQLIQKKVQMSFMVTSTALHLNSENASRCLIISTDESKHQTGKVQERLGFNHDFEGCITVPAEAEKIKMRHHAAQRLLEIVYVFNPFWKYIKFPQARPSMRRSYEQFLTMIDTICYLRQQQKPDLFKTNPATGAKVRCKACDLYDYQLAYNLFTEGILNKSGYDISTGTRELYNQIRLLVQDKAKSEKIKTCEISFIQKQIREYTQLGAEFIKKHIRILVSYEYLEVMGGKRHGTRYAYRLREDRPIEELDISMITTPEELKMLIEKDKIA